MKSKTWKYVQGFVSVELALDENGNVFNPYSEKEFEEFALLKPFISADGSEVVINFVSSGFYEPESRFGGPDSLGNPEYLFDERTLDNVKIGGKTLPQEIAEKIFDCYFSEVEEAELVLEEEFEDT